MTGLRYARTSSSSRNGQAASWHRDVPAAKQWLIDDAGTSVCREGMKANSGAWNAELGVWAFPSLADLLNALAVLYEATRATASQRKMLLDLIADGTAEQAWAFTIASLTGAWFEKLDRHEARHLIAEGVAVRRMLGHLPFLDTAKASREVRIDAMDFERELAAIQARMRCGRETA